MRSFSLEVEDGEMVDRPQHNCRAIAVDPDMISFMSLHSPT
jgi:hypothetical protein